MTVIAPSFLFSHRVMCECESNQIVVLASRSIQYRTEFATVVIPADEHSQIDAICDYYKNAKQAVMLVVDSKHERKNTIRVLKNNFSGSKVRVLDIANQKTLPSPSKDGLAYLYCALEITRSGIFAVLAAKRALRLMPFIYENPEDLVAQYLIDENLILLAVRSIKKQLKRIHRVVLSDFEHSCEPVENIDVNSLNVLSMSEFKDSHTLAIYAATGTGKTEAVIAPIARQASSTNQVVYISNLIALVNQFCEKTEAISYQEKDRKKFQNANAIAVVINSLWKPHILAKVYEADVIIIDEFEKVVKAVVCSENSKSMQADKVFEALCLVLKNARQVIVADADLTDISIGFLNTLRGGKLTLIDSSENPYNSMKAVLRGKNAFLQNKNLKERLFTEKVFLFDSLKTLKESIVALGYVNSEGLDCEDAALREGVLVIHGDNKDMPAQAAFLANPNSEIVKYRAVIASPCLGAGFSITTAYTDTVNIIADGTYIPRELVNFARRFRAAKTLSFAIKETTFYFDDKCFSFFGEKQKQKTKFEKQKQNLNAHLAISLRFTLEKLGFSVEHITQSQEKQQIGNSGASKRRREFDEKQMLAVMRGQDLTFEQFKLLSSSNSKTSKDLSSLERFDIKQFYNLSDLVEKDVRFHRYFDRLLFAHFPFILNLKQLERMDVYSSERQRAGTVISDILFQGYDFKDDKSSLFVRRRDSVNIVNQLYEYKGILNNYLPTYLKIQKVSNTNMATRYLNSLTPKFGLDMGRYGGKQQKSRISMTHYAKMYKAYLLTICN